jgi:hypothetical protein
MTPKPATMTVRTQHEATPTWAPCPTCWGQRQIWTRVEAPNGEGAMLVAGTCPGCLGVGEVVR